MQLRYMGFDQHDNTRAYKFDGIEDGHLSTFSTAT